MSDPPRIYVVDDDKAVLRSVKALLGEVSRDVRCYLSGEQFLNEVAIDQPGCLVTDLQMPGITGTMLQQHLNQAKSPISIIFVTGVADIPLAMVLRKNGAVTLLEKPYEPTDLLDAVESGLRASQQRWQSLQAEVY